MEYINGVMNYTGSKFKLLEQIIPELDTTKKYFVDLFAGSFVVGINVVNLYDKILANDIVDDVIKIHKKIIYEPNEFINNVKNLSMPCKVSKEKYNELRSSYNTDKTPEKLYALMLSCMSNMIRWNRKREMNQTWGKRCFNDSTQNKIDNFINYIKPYKDQLFFISKNFYDIKISKPSMIYIDPPYGHCIENNEIVTKQISDVGYNRGWKKEDDIKLYNYCLELDKNGSSFMLSGLLKHNNNISWILTKLIKNGFKYKELNFDYNKVSKKGKKDTKEIIVMNYEK